LIQEQVSLPRLSRTCSVLLAISISDLRRHIAGDQVRQLQGLGEVAGFQLLPRRWVVERTLAWLNRNRRLAKDFEASIASAKAWVYIALVQLLIRRLS
jgi:transposase